jgi:trimeric autotransporter adhesin
MSTNLVRKGLTFGAVVALGSTLLAGAPAFAADVNLVPTTGTLLNTISGESFSLTTSLGSNIPAGNFAQQKFLVTNTSGVAATATIGGAAPTAGGAIAATDATKVVSKSGQTSGPATLELVVAATATASYTVTSWVDTDNSGTINNGESSSAPVTVGFVKAADVTSTVTVSPVVAGDVAVKATIALAGINTAQIAVGHFGASVAKGSATAVLGTVAYDTNGALAVTSAALTSAAGDVFKVQGLYKLAGSAAITDVIGSNASATAAAAGFAFFASVKGSAASNEITTVTSGASAYTDSVTSANSVTAATGAINVKKNDSFAVTAVVKNNATTPAVVAGQVVYATITSSNALAVASGSTPAVSVTVNGTVYTAATALPGQGSVAKLALTSDANGAVVLNIASAGLVDGNTITVAFTSQNISVSTVVTEKDLTYSVSESNVNDVYSTTPGAATALTYSVKDQFSQAIAGAYRVKAVVTGGTANTYYVNVAAGSATVNVADTQLATATSWTNNTVAATLEVQDAASGNWSTQAITAGDSTVIHYTTAANDFATAPALADVNGAAYVSSTPTKQTLATGAYADLVVPASLTLGDSVWARLTLTGTNVGQKYTVSGTGVAIWANAKSNIGSATVQASGSAESVFVASNTTGTKTITFVTGSVTKTVDVVFAAATTASAYKIVLGDLAAVSQAGRSVDIIATVTDKFGNVVSGATAVLTSTGVGYLANTTTPTNAAGQIAGKLIVGALENGDAVVTATLTLADATTATVSKTVSFGATDAQIDIVNNRVTAVASFSKGKTVAFYVDGVKKWSKVSASDADVVLNYNLRKGTHNITVKISGGFVTTEKFIVK